MREALGDFASYFVSRRPTSPPSRILLQTGGGCEVSVAATRNYAPISRSLRPFFRMVRKIDRAYARLRFV